MASADCLLSTISSRSYQRWPSMKIKFRPWKLMVDFFFEFRSIFEVFVAVLKHPADSVLLEEVCQTQNRGKIVETVKHVVWELWTKTLRRAKHMCRRWSENWARKNMFCSNCYGFGTNFTHVQTCVITSMFKVLRNGLFRYKLCACPSLLYRSC